MLKVVARDISERRCSNCRYWNTPAISKGVCNRIKDVGIENDGERAQLLVVGEGTPILLTDPKFSCSEWKGA